MKLAPIGYQDSISYTSNNETRRMVVQPVNNDKKQTRKKVGLALAGVALLAFALTKGKSLGKIFGKLGGESKTVAEGSKSAGEKIEEIVPEVLDFDTVWGPKISQSKSGAIKPKTVVIDSKGRVINDKKQPNTASNFFKDVYEQSEKSGKYSVFDAFVDIIDDFTWMI